MRYHRIVEDLDRLPGGRIIKLGVAMITIGMNYQVLEGKGHAFERKFAAVQEAMGLSSGHIKTSLYKDAFNADSYLIVSEWSSESDFDGFVSSDAFKKVTDWGAANILAGRPVHTVYGGK